MAKCANCGEVNPDTNAFCSKCGQPLAKPEEKSASELAYENAQKEFENDAKVSADKSKLTYICELCGTINRIENGSCSKCGKPRPRSEYIKALNNYRQNTQDGQALVAAKQKVAQEEAAKRAAEEAAKAAAEKKAAEEAAAKAAAEKKAAEEAAKANGTAIQEPVQQFVEKKDEKVVRAQNAPANHPAPAMNVTPTAGGGVMISNAPSPAQQSGPVVQPFVIVPYVDSTQKLWQYQPRQIYKFQPYSYEEKDRIKQRQLELQQGKDPTIEELNRMRERKQGEINSLNDVIDSKLPVDQRLVTFNAKKQKIRTCAVATLIFSVIMLLATIALPVFTGDMSSLKGIELFKYIGNCLRGSNLAAVSFGTSVYSYNGPANFVLPIVYILSTVLSVVIAIQSVIRLVNGNASSKGYIMPLICLLLAVGAAVSLLFFTAGGYNANTFNASSALEALKSINYGFYIYFISAIAMVIIGGCAPVNGKMYR